jgi:hypothetical protein
LTRIPFAVFRSPSHCGAPGGSALGSHAAAPSHRVIVRREILSQALAPLQSVTIAALRSARCPTDPKAGLTNTHPLLPRFLPLQRLANRGEPLTSDGIPTHRLRCALRVSHPLDALLPPRSAGLVSSRFRSWGSPFGVFLPPTEPCALSSAATLLTLDSTPQRPVLAFRAWHPAGDPARRTWGLARHQRRIPPWAFSLSRLLAPPGGRTLLANARPLSRFLGSAFWLTAPPTPQGICRVERNRSLSRPVCPLEVSYLVDSLDSLVTPPRWVIGSPRKRLPCHHRTVHPLRVAVGLPAGAHRGQPYR